MGAPDAQALLAGPNQNKRGNGNNKGISPLFLIIMGACLLLLGISTSMFDIQASEAMVSGIQINSFIPNWQLLGQIPQIISGRELPANIAAGYYTGWIIELASLILVVAYELALDAIIHAPKWVVGCFKWGIYGIAVINITTNFIYMPGIPAWYVRLFVAVLIAVSSFFFPIIGVFCMERGVRNW